MATPIHTNGGDELLVIIVEVNVAGQLLRHKDRQKIMDKFSFQEFYRLRNENNGT